MNTRKRDYKFLLGYDIRIPTMILFWFNLIELSDVTDTKVWKVFLRHGIFVFSRGKKSCWLQRKKERVKDPMSLHWSAMWMFLLCTHAQNSISTMKRTRMLVSLSLVYWFFTIFVPTPSKQQTKHVMTLSVCKNVRILIFVATGCAANVLRAPGSTVK